MRLARVSYLFSRLRVQIDGIKKPTSRFDFHQTEKRTRSAEPSAAPPFSRSVINRIVTLSKPDRFPVISQDATLSSVQQPKSAQPFKRVVLFRARALLYYRISLQSNIYRVRRARISLYKAADSPDEGFRRKTKSKKYMKNENENIPYICTAAAVRFVASGKAKRPRKINISEQLVSIIRTFRKGGNESVICNSVYTHGRGNRYGAAEGRGSRECL